MALQPEAAAASRLALQATLEEILGSQNVYFQPPTNVQIQYPCIVYKRDNADTGFAGNRPYRYEQRYQLTYISRDPDELTPLKIAALPQCVNVRYYTVKNLNHDVFTLYY
jgi:hypothetical protein